MYHEGQVSHRHTHANTHHGPADSEEAHEADGVSCLCSHARHDHVCARANERAHTPVVGAEAESPRQGLDLQTLDVGGHALNDRDHRGGERNVIHEGRCDCGDNLNQDSGNQRPLCDGHGLDDQAQLVGDQAKQTQLGDTLGEHEQSREEQQRVPLHLLQCVLEISRRPHEEYRDGAEERGVRGLEVNHRVQEEQNQHETQDDPRARQEREVADRVPFLELLDVDADILAVQRGAVVPPQESECGEQREDDARGEYPEEIHEADLVLQRVPDDEVGRVSDHRTRAAYVAEQRHGYEHGSRVLTDGSTQGDDHGPQQEHGGDVVKERAEHAVEQHEHPRESPHVHPRRLDETHADKLEHPRAR
mmetsp:Transcript_27418/g.68656  ORF Transcript_27418/g.68656 Transcript_27418/m.68656 type:complete len:362 (+) Transcript_27418:616-1701(+)